MIAGGWMSARGPSGLGRAGADDPDAGMVLYD